jgi:UDP-2-acetamido-3-amino-2,3-dideoxy-glucuronate N-acetyltransferase
MDRVRTLPGVTIHESAYVDAPCAIGEGTAVWHFCHVQSGARIGRGCTLGQNVFVGAGVTIGDRVKIQNNVSVYAGCEIEDDVFLGPSCVLTNVTNPRAQVDRRALYEPTRFRRGATVGANATVVCGVTLGRYSFVAAGSVVTRDVPDYALVVGNPARQRGWMSRHGHRLTAGADGVMTCPESGLRYREEGGREKPGPDGAVLRCLDLDEDAPLPPGLARGDRPYDGYKPT